jgi:cytochrome c553
MKKSGCIALMVMIPFTASALGNAEQGKTKSEVCAACHGVDGNSMNPEWPSLAGQHEKYLVTQLKAFKIGQAPGGRYGPLMAPIVANLTDQDIEDLAAYFSSQTLKVGAVPKEHVELGQAIYRGGDLKKGLSACIACHGPQGLGNAEANFPSLSGQQPTYVTNQLKKYKSGERNTGSNSVIMQQIAQHMDEKEMVAIGYYVSGLH